MIESSISFHNSVNGFENKIVNFPTGVSVGIHAVLTVRYNIHMSWQSVCNFPSTVNIELLSKKISFHYSVKEENEAIRVERMNHAD